jgi:hypothetical protein
VASGTFAAATALGLGADKSSLACSSVGDIFAPGPRRSTPASPSASASPNALPARSTKVRAERRGDRTGKWAVEEEDYARSHGVCMWAPSFASFQRGAHFALP